MRKFCLVAAVVLGLVVQSFAYAATVSDYMDGVAANLATAVVKDEKNGNAFRDGRLELIYDNLRRLSQALSRKVKGSKNRNKARQRLARLHARIADARKDFLHKLSTQLIRENQAVFMEDLCIKGMMRTRLARSIGDAAWGELLRQLTYKAQWYGRIYWQADRFFASSKTCHACGFKLKELPLSVREWTCPKCSKLHDRDKNAARNILAAGMSATATAGRAGS